MEKSYQNTKNQVAEKNNISKPEHVITAEFSIEVTGEDEPTKYEKRRERWALLAFWFFIIGTISGIIFVLNIDIYSFWVTTISQIGFGISFVNALNVSHDPTGPMPWWYGA